MNTHLSFHSSLSRNVALSFTLFVFAALPATPGPRVLPEGQLPDDRRLQALKDYDGYFPFTPSESPAAWHERAEGLRRHMLVSLGLWPLPTRTPLNAVVHGRIDQPDYTVEKVFFESMPGFFVTGNLYRPKGKPGRLPGVLCPHGHWPNGRFTDNPKVAQEIVVGAERFEEGGRSVLQARCVQLARMGCVVFHYDMVGYADSTQISMDVAHAFAKQRPEMNSPENWGLFSPQAESHLQSVMGLQTWNSMRSLDFLIALDDVDSGRIGITGASGGGTQSFILSAIDPRVTVSFPAVMVSTGMQGGCTCENACGLRIDTGNVEFAAMFAPKPLGLTGADDWTREMSTKGFPQLKQHYAMLGKPNSLFFKPFNHFDHNYNYPSRAVMYSWMNKHLKLGLQEPVLEQDYHRLNPEELAVWDKSHPTPEGGPSFEKQLLRWWHTDAEEQIKAAAATGSQFDDLVGKSLQAVVGRGLPDAGALTLEDGNEQEGDVFTAYTGRLREPSRGEETPALFFMPKNADDWKGRIVIWVHPDGKSGLCDPDQTRSFKPNASVKRLLEAGIGVAGLDLLYQGEFLKEGERMRDTRKVPNPRESAAFTFGYNPSVFAHRVHDILRMVSYVKNHERSPKSVELVGLGGAGHWVAAAQALSQSSLTRVALDSEGFRFGAVTRIQDPNFLPGGAKYGDLPGMLALGTSRNLWIAGEPAQSQSQIKAVFEKAGVPQNVTLTESGDAQAVVAWLLAGGH